MGVGVHFTLYERVYCHLCHEMERALLALLNELGQGKNFTIDAIDVDQDESLENLYGERVPVLFAGDRELCHYHLDTAAVRAYLDEIR